MYSLFKASSFHYHFHFNFFLNNSNLACVCSLFKAYRSCAIHFSALHNLSHKTVQNSFVMFCRELSNRGHKFFNTLLSVGGPSPEVMGWGTMRWNTQQVTHSTYFPNGLIQWCKYSEKTLRESPPSNKEEVSTVNLLHILCLCEKTCPGKSKVIHS